MNENGLKFQKEHQNLNSIKNLVSWKENKSKKF